MTRDEIYNKLTPIMRNTFDDYDLVPTDSTTSEDVSEWDSSNHVRLIVAIEIEFQIRFETDEIYAPENVGQLVNLIQAKMES